MTTISTSSMPKQARISILTDMDKKSELMIMRRARTYSSSCSQVVLILVHPSSLNSLCCSRKSQKYLKLLFLKFKVIQSHSKSFMLIPLESTSPVLVISSTSLPICKRFRARQANSGKITTFMVPLFDTRVRMPR